LLFCIATALTFTAYEVQAQNPNKKQEKKATVSETLDRTVDDLSFKVSLKKESFLNNIVLYEEAPVKDKGLSYKVGSYKIRSVVQRNGARVILSEYSLPLEDYEENANTQKWSMTLFRLSNPSKNLEGLTEEQEYLGLAGHYYPAGWMSVTGDYDSIHDITVNIARRKEVVGKRFSGNVHMYMENSRGYIDTQLISKSVLYVDAGERV